jgi:methyl-accepting chemotaxis protein
MVIPVMSAHTETEQFYAPPTPAEYEEAYQDILVIYDIAEELSQTLHDARATHQADQVELVEPLVNDLLDAADDLSQQFCEFAGAADKKQAAKQFSMRDAFKKIFRSVNNAMESIQEIGGEVAENITTVMLPTLEKLVRHTERLFSRLVVLVEHSKDIVQRKRREFHEMINVEAHVATLMRQQQAARGF